MTISSQPLDSESIVELQENDFGERVYVATESFSTFLNDLVDIVNSANVVTVQSESSLHEHRSVLARLASQINQLKNSHHDLVNLNQFLMAENQTQARQIRALSDALNSANNLAADQGSLIAAFQKEIYNLKESISRVENLCL